MKNLRIGVTALTNRIFLGKVDKVGINFTGNKQDVTSDVLKSVIEYVQNSNQENEVVVNVNGEPKYKIKVETL